MCCKDCANDNLNDNTKLDKMKIYMFSSPYTLNRYLDLIFSPIENDTTDNLYRCAIWLSYMGLTVDEMSCIKITDVDLYRRVIVYNNHPYIIFDEAFASIENCVKAPAYYYPNNSYYNKKGIWRDRVGDYLLRGKNPSLKPKTIADTVYAIGKRAYANGVASKMIHFEELSLSGQFYNLRKDQLERGVEPDMKSLVLFQMSKRSRTSPEGSRIFKSCVSKNKRVMRDKYLQWCEAGVF